MRRGKRYQPGGLINTTGYLKGAKTNQNSVNIIPSGHITTQDMTGPILANGHLLMPDTGDYMFPASHVVERKLGKGGHTISTPQYLSTYPNDNNTTPMPKSPRGKRMQKGGRHFDPQLGNYMSNIYAIGGLTYPSYPYAGYNDSERGMFAGMMQQGGPMPMPGPAGAMPQQGMMPPGMPPQMPPMQGPQQQQAPPRGGKGMRSKGGKRGKMQGGGSMTAQSVARAKDSGYDDASAVDHINSILSGGSRDVGWGNPAQNQLAMQAYMWHQQHAGGNPGQTIQGFYGRPSSGVPAADSVRQRLSSIGGGPLSMYNSTPNISVAAPQPGGIAASFQIGGSTSVPSYRTSKIVSRFQPDQSGGEMPDDWKDVFYGNPDMKKGGWISKAVNPAHKGYCTPMSKPTCTGHRRALALLFKKKHGFHKKQEGGEYLQGMEMQQGGYSPYGPQYNFGATGHAPTSGDSADYRNAYDLMRTGSPEANSNYIYTRDTIVPGMTVGRGYSPGALGGAYSTLNAYNDALHAGTVHLTLPADTKRPKQRRGGNLRGRMQQGGFQAAGSLIDQNMWAMGSEGTPIVPPSGNYYKTDPSQTSMTGALPGQPATVPLTNMHHSYQVQQNPNNHPALQALLPINAGLNSLAQHNDWNQRHSSYIQANTNPLSTMGYDDGRTQESRFGYGNYQKGGETIPFAGRMMHLWQRGGSLPGASRTFRPYMLHQGAFQQGGQAGGMDLMDQWDVEDGQDATDTQLPQQTIPYDEDQGYNSEIQRRTNLSNDEDYQAALGIAAGKSLLNNPYLW